MITTARYARVSRAESAKKDLSIPTQLQGIDKHRRLAEEILIKDYVAEGISGDTDDNGAMQQLLRDARDGSFKRLYVYSISRFSRDPRLRENWLFELRQLCGIEIIFLDIPMSQDHYTYEQYERERGNRARDISIEGKEGSLRGQRQLASEGFKAGGTAKYGYMLKKEARRRSQSGETIYNSRLAPNPETFPIAQEILTCLAEHESHSSIAKDLNGRQIPGPSAWDSYGNLLKKCKKCRCKYPLKEHPNLETCTQCGEELKQPRDFIWYKSSIANIEQEAEWTYSGKNRYNYHNARIKTGEYRGQYLGGRFIDGKYVGTKFKPQSEWVFVPCEACIDEATLAKIVSYRSTKPTQRKGHGRRNSTPHLFQISCTCGGQFTKRGQGNLGCNLRLSGKNDCTSPIIKEKRVEKTLLRFIQDKLLSPEIIDEITQLAEERLQQSPYDRLQDLKETRTRLRRVEAKLKDYKRLFDGDKIGADAFVEYTEDLRLERSTLKQQLDSLEAEYAGDTPILTRDAVQLWQSEMTMSLQQPEREKLADLLAAVIKDIVLHPPQEKRGSRLISFTFYPFFEGLGKKKGSAESALPSLSVPKGI